MTRREAMQTTAAFLQTGGVQFDPALVARHDTAVENQIKQQITDPSHPRRGSTPDAFGLFADGTASGIFDALITAYLCPQSRHYHDKALVERMTLASGYLDRWQTSDGNVTLPITNFNSPPDTAFVVWGAAAAAHKAILYREPGLARLLENFLRRAGRALTVGGIHTPNHRWVVSSALANIHELYPDTSYVRRIDQWLSEGIDIDPDGQFTERSTATYNGIVDRALVLLAIKLKRPELLEPVRRNLDAMMYLLHPGGEVVTEISTRQDRNTRGTMAGYWLPLRYLAALDRNGRYSAMARMVDQAASLSALMEYPELSTLPESAALPEDYEKIFPHIGVARIRRGLTSATLPLGHDSRLLILRRGDAVINAVRFASAFFGKGQFVPASGAKHAQAYVFEQSLEAPYYQPLDPPRRVSADDWMETRRLRRQTEICRMQYSADVTERAAGFTMRLRAAGTDHVPVAVEINLREGGQLEGCSPAPHVADAWILKNDYATYRVGRHAIRFGPGAAPHQYTQVRGAEPKMPGPSVYITGYTPFDRSLEFEWL